MSWKEKLNKLAEKGKEVAGDLADKAGDIYEKEKELLSKQSKEIFVSVTLTSGKDYFPSKLTSSLKIWKQVDDLIYFDNNTDELYDYQEYYWEGPRFTKKGEGIDKEIVEAAKKAGDVVGDAFNRVIKNSDARYETLDDEDSVEVETPAYMIFRSVDDGKEIKLGFNCDRRLDSKIKYFIKNNPKDVKR